MDNSLNTNFFHILKSYKWYIIISVLLALISTAVYLHFAPNVYKSYTIIEVKDDKNNIGGKDILLSALTGYSSSGVDKDIELLKTFEINKKILEKISFNNAEKNLDNLDIYNNIITKNLHISRLKKNISLIKIEFFDTNPVRATEYVQTLADTFISQNIYAKSEQNNKIINFIDRELESIKNKLKASERRLKRYQESNKVINPSAQSKTLIKRLSEVEVKLANNRLQRELINSIYASIDLNQHISAISPILKSLNEESTLQLISMLQDAEIKIKELSNEYTYKHPKIVELTDKIQMLKGKIYGNIKNLKWSIDKESKNLNRLKLKYNKELKSYPQKEKYLINMKRDYEVNAKTYKYLLEKKSENEIIKVAILADYKVVEQAYIPKNPVRPKKVSYMIVAFISSLLFGIFLALSANRFSRVIKHLSDIKILNSESIKLYHSLPSYRKGRKKFIESCKKISSRVQLMPNRDIYSKVILISSINDNQGKTTLAINLAKIFKDMHDKTVIIDFNISRPNIHTIFNVDNSVGLGTYLSGGHKLYEIIKHTKHRNLDIIPIGLTPPNPSKLLFSENFPKLLGELKGEYSHIIIDTASTDSSYETLNLMKYADVNLFIFKLNVSRKESIETLEQFIGEYNIKNIGIILNEYS